MIFLLRRTGPMHIQVQFQFQFQFQVPVPVPSCLLSCVQFKFIFSSSSSFSSSFSSPFSVSFSCTFSSSFSVPRSLSHLIMVGSSTVYNIVLDLKIYSSLVMEKFVLFGLGWIGLGFRGNELRLQLFSVEVRGVRIAWRVWSGRSGRKLFLSPVSSRPPTPGPSSRFILSQALANTNLSIYSRWWKSATSSAGRRCLRARLRDGMRFRWGGAMGRVRFMRLRV